MKVLSLFDGMSCGRIALERSNIGVDAYYASEIDKHAIKVCKHNYPDTIHIGDVRNVRYKEGILYTENGEYEVGKIDLLIGGSPCQQLSRLGDGKGLDGEKSGLFFEYLRLKNELEAENPDLKFVLENVVSSKKNIDLISDLIGTTPVLFNSNIVSAQNRSRYYWSNIQFSLPADKGIELTDILEDGIPAESILTPGRYRWLESESGKKCLKSRYAVIDPNKANCLTARSDASWNSNYVTRNGIVTRLTPTEYERLQTVPDGYTSIAPTTERYKMLGNGWTVDVISHIFNGIKPATE